MKVNIKTPKQIETMKAGGQILATTLEKLVEFTKPGLTLLEIDTLADKLIHEAGGKPGFKTVEDYQWATCINVNDGVVHGIPNGYIIEKGDVVSIDVGVLYHGLHTDMSTTFQVEVPSTKDQVPNEKENFKFEESRVERFLKAGKESLSQSIAQVKPGNRVGDISQMMQSVIESYGYQCADNLTGHGIGAKLHEYPPVPCMLFTAVNQTPILKAGMSLAIEVIYFEGSNETTTDTQDGWTIRTKDGKLAAVFEKTILATSEGYEILTPSVKV